MSALVFKSTFQINGIRNTNISIAQVMFYSLGLESNVQYFRDFAGPGTFRVEQKGIQRHSCKLFTAKGQSWKLSALRAYISYYCH